MQLMVNKDDLKLTEIYKFLIEHIFNSNSINLREFNQLNGIQLKNFYYSIPLFKLLNFTIISNTSSEINLLFYIHSKRLLLKSVTKDELKINTKFNNNFTVDINDRMILIKFSIILSLLYDYTFIIKDYLNNLNYIQFNFSLVKITALDIILSQLVNKNYLSLFTNEISLIDHNIENINNLDKMKQFAYENKSKHVSKFSNILNLFPSFDSFFLLDKFNSIFITMKKFLTEMISQPESNEEEIYIMKEAFNFYLDEEYTDKIDFNLYEDDQYNYEKIIDYYSPDECDDSDKLEEEQEHLGENNCDEMIKMNNKLISKSHHKQFKTSKKSLSLIKN